MTSQEAIGILMLSPFYFKMSPADRKKLVQEYYPDALLFRAYGNDFAILTRKHFDMEDNTFDSFTSMSDSEITVESQHIDLLQDTTYSFDKLEKMVVSAPLSNDRELGKHL